MSEEELKEKPEKEKLPINITFEIERHKKPNDRWVDVTAVLSWEQAKPEPYIQRMDSCMVLANEVDDMKDAICFLVGRHFSIKNTEDKIIQGENNVC